MKRARKPKSTSRASAAVIPEQTRVIAYHQYGGPEVLQVESRALMRPGRGEVLLHHRAIGLNFIDIYGRTGLYPGPLPAIPGFEGAGEVVAVGPGVRGLAVGQRVAYTNSRGAYADWRLLPAAQAVPLPAGVTCEVAAAIMLKGLTAEMLLRRIYPVKKDDFVLIHSAAGGVGSLMTQWARVLGAKVMGTVGSASKAELARRQGCHRVFVLGSGSWVDGVRDFTRGKMAHVVYDSVGKDTFADSLSCLRKRGMMVSFGNSSGPAPAFTALELGRSGGGSLFLTRPTLFDYLTSREELLAASRAMFRLVTQGRLKVNIGQRYPLDQAARAQADLAGRKTQGSTVLLPD